MYSDISVIQRGFVDGAKGNGSWIQEIKCMDGASGAGGAAGADRNNGSTGIMARRSDPLSQRSGPSRGSISTTAGMAAEPVKDRGGPSNPGAGGQGGLGAKADRQADLADRKDVDAGAKVDLRVGLADRKDVGAGAKVDLRADLADQKRAEAGAKADRKDADAGAKDVLVADLVARLTGRGAGVVVRGWDEAMFVLPFSRCWPSSLYTATKSSSR